MGLDTRIAAGCREFQKNTELKKDELAYAAFTTIYC